MWEKESSWLLYTVYTAYMWIYFASLTKPITDVSSYLYDHLYGHLASLCSQCFCILCVILYADSQVSDVHINLNQKLKLNLYKHYKWIHPTCSGGYGCGGGWYRLTLFTGLFPALVAIFTSAHSVMSGVTFWLKLHVRCNVWKKETNNEH